MKPVQLSKRLQTIADMVTPGVVAADVGCDHALLSVYLIENGISPLVFATDVHKGPLRRALETVQKLGLSGQIETILCDGLTGLSEKKVDCVILAGMGGPLITEILKASPEVLKGVKELILEPQSEPGLVRHYLQDNGFLIISESMVCEENKFYPVIKCIHGTMRLERECYFRYGKILLRERNPLLMQYLYTRRRLLREILAQLEHKDPSESVRLRSMELAQELNCIGEAIQLIEAESPVEIERTLD
ncbi:MAG: SAM-dependent methyltransferase [Lachnospiraceae bacterium]|nr:SAM-dependent methyltransferase [Lachnospiraceae bacterium]